MTKKILFGLSAIAMLFVTSCQNDLDSAVNVGKTSAVTFSVTTPQIATRAYSDGTTATKLEYAVYDSEGNHLSELDGETDITNLSATVDFQLTTGDSYSVLFWAAAKNAPYDFDPAAKKVTVDYNGAVCNDEARDAFYARHDFTVNGVQTEEVYLYRPFAQLNIGTNDYDAARKSGYEPTLSAVTVKNIYNTLNLFDGTVEGSDAITFDYAAIDTTEAYPVSGYKYVSMNYLLVADYKEVVEVEFAYKEADKEAKTRIVGSVPVQRNYRTNLYGQLFTSKVGIKVQIVPDYNMPDYLFPSNSKEALILAATVGGEVTLYEDVNLDQPLVFTKNARINLNGWTITGGIPWDEVAKPNGTMMSALTVNDGAIVSISGDGKVIGAGYGINVINGTLNLSDATVEGAYTGIQLNEGTLNIESGYFYITENGRVINCIDTAYGAGLSNVNITGGTFKQFDPANNESEGPGTNFCAPGYISVADGENYIVVKGSKVTNEEELKTAAKSVQTDVIAFGQDIDISDAAAPYMHINREVKFNTNGYKFETANASNYGIFCNAGSIVTFEKADIVANGGALVARDGAQVVFNEGSIKIESSATAHRHMVYAYGEGTTVVINDGEFSFDAYRKRTYAYVASGAVVLINGGTFGAAPNHPNDANSPFMTEGGQVIIKGGTFGFNPTAWVADGYAAVQNGSVWTVSANN